jgi:hypothetical protein
VSTASRNCRIHQQRLQAERHNARSVSGSFGGGPWALRPKRLQWLTNITAEFKIAAPSVCGLKLFFPKSISLQQGAMSWHSPPFFLRAHDPPEGHNVKRQNLILPRLAGRDNRPCRHGLPSPYEKAKATPLIQLE